MKFLTKKKNKKTTVLLKYKSKKKSYKKSIHLHNLRYYFNTKIEEKFVRKPVLNPKKEEMLYNTKRIDLQNESNTRQL